MGIKQYVSVLEEALRKHSGITYKRDSNREIKAHTRETRRKVASLFEVVRLLPLLPDVIEVSTAQTNARTMGQLHFVTRRVIEFSEEVEKLGVVFIPEQDYTSELCDYVKLWLEIYIQHICAFVTELLEREE